MKLETIETTTLYIALPAVQLPAVREHDWREIPDPGDEVVLCSAPALFCPGGPSAGVSPCTVSRAGSTRLVLRLQVRADYLAGIVLRSAGEGIEARLSPGQIPELNHNLVGPLALESVLVAEESSAPEPLVATTPSEARIPVMC